MTGYVQEDPYGSAAELCGGYPQQAVQEDPYGSAQDDPYGCDALLDPYGGGASREVAEDPYGGGASREVAEDPYGGGASREIASPVDDGSAQAIQEAMRALYAARNSNDLSALADAITVATRAGVSMEAIERAAHDEEERWAHQELEAIAAARAQTLHRRDLAAEVLESVARGENVDDLESALERAEQAGVSTSALESGRARKGVLLAAVERQHRRLEAEQALELARSSHDSNVIEAAIEKATVAGVGVGAIAAARKRKMTLETAKKDQTRTVTTRTLEAAVKGSDLKVLLSAIEWACKTGVLNEAIVRARKRVAALRAEGRRERTCDEERRALEHAMESSNLDALTTAIESASNTGVNVALIKCASKRKLALEQQERKKQKTEKSEAVEALALISSGSDLEALSGCIEWAVNSGVEESLLKTARKRMASLQEGAQRQEIVDEALTALETVMDGTDVAVLELAIQEAENKGIKRAAIDRARNRCEELGVAAQREKAHDEAVQGLEEALGLREIGAVKRAIELAVQAGVGEAEISLVRKKEAALEAEKALQDALSSQDLQKCTVAIRRAQQVGDCQELVEVAQASLNAWKQAEKERIAEEAQERLVTLMNGTDLVALQHAYTLAVRAGVAEAKLQEARDRVHELQEHAREQASQRLQSAIAGNDFDEVSAAITAAKRAGVCQDLMSEGFCRQKALRAEKEAKRIEAHATSALASAMQGDDLGLLSAAIDRAEVLALDEELLASARKKKLCMQDSERKGQAWRMAANVLQSAVQVADVAGLELAICWAQEAGVSSDAISHARSVKDTLVWSKERHDRAAASKDLHAALLCNDLAQLSKAVDRATKAGVADVEIQRARDRHSILELELYHRREQAEEALTAAIRNGVLRDLQETIGEAEKMGTNDELLCQARQMRSSLEEEASRRDAHQFAEVSQALESAMNMGNADLLASTISWAENVGTNLEVVERARRRHDDLVRQR